VADGKESASARYLAADGLAVYHVRCRCNYGFSFNRLIVFVVIRKLSEVPICIARFIMSNSRLRRSGVARVNEGSHNFTCHPHVYPQVE